MNKFNVGDVVSGGAYNGFVITGVSKGWYKGHFPSNVTPSCSVENATTSVRWFWVESSANSVHRS